MTTSALQREIAQKLTLAFSNIVRQISTQPEHTDYANLQECRRLVDAEAIQIATRYSRIDAVHPQLSIIECLTEATTSYYENDQPNIGPGFIPGNPIYSPRVDLVIAPTIRLPGQRKNRAIGTYPLVQGRDIFLRMSRLDVVQTIRQGFETFTSSNYDTVGLRFEQGDSNYRPLCLFAIEIENQNNLKHMMGDFINAIMLAKYAIVVVPEDKLHNCLNLIKTASVIENIKRVRVFSLFKQSFIVTIPQLLSVVNRILSDNGIQPING